MIDHRTNDNLELPAKPARAKLTAGPVQPHRGKFGHRTGNPNTTHTGPATLAAGETRTPGNIGAILVTPAQMSTPGWMYDQTNILSPTAVAQRDGRQNRHADARPAPCRDHPARLRPPGPAATTPAATHPARLQTTPGY
jgi:hypothetical protein